MKLEQFIMRLGSDESLPEVIHRFNTKPSVEAKPQPKFDLDSWSKSIGGEWSGTVEYQNIPILPSLPMVF